MEFGYKWEHVLVQFFRSKGKFLRGATAEDGRCFNL